MNLTFHIFKKDARRLAWPVMGLISVSIAQIGLTGAPWGALADETLAMRVNFFGLLLSSSVSYLLVMSLISEDSVAGGNAFWITRPISGARLLGAKLAGIVLLLWMPPLMIWLPWWLAHGYGTSELGAAAAKVLLPQVVVTMLALPIAALSEKSSKFLLISLVGLMLFPAFTMLFVANFGGASHVRIPIGVIETRGWIFMGVFIVTVIAVAVNQFLTRRSWLSWAIIFAALLAILAVARFWSWDLHSKGMRNGGPSPVTAREIR